MRPEPKFSPDAQADVAYAVDYYNARRPNLGYDFLDEVQALTSLIRESPFLFTLVDAPIRRALLHRFPYGAFYVPGGSDDSDVIVAVVDLRQDPDVIRLAYRR
jgi:hypothetical protein